MLDNLFLKQLEIQGQDVLLNDKETKVVLKDIDSDKSVPTGKIFSADKLENGDIITIGDIKYIIIDSYKQKNKSYYIGEYSMAYDCWYCEESQRNIKPQEVLGAIHFYGAVTNFSNSINSSGNLMSTSEDKYLFIIDSKSVNIDLTNGYLYSCGVCVSINSVDKTKNDMFYVLGKIDYRYNLSDDYYNIELSDKIVYLNQENPTYDISCSCKKNGEYVSSYESVSYKSNDESVALVDNNGRVSIIPVTEKGIIKTTTITCTYAEASADLIVNVSFASHDYIVTLDKSEITLNDNDNNTYTLKATCIKDDVVQSSPTVTWTSNNSLINVSNNGVVKINSLTQDEVGIITCNYNGVKAECIVNAIHHIPTYKLIISTTSINLNDNKNKTYKIDYTCKADGVVVSSPNITFSTNSSNIIVDNNGLVTVNPLTADETAIITCVYEGITKEVTINATHDNVDIYTIEIDANNGTFEGGATYQLTPICKKNNVVVNNPTVIYSSNNTNAVVDNNGLITFTATSSKQTGIITLYYENTSCEFSFTINNNGTVEIKKRTVYQNYATPRNYYFIGEIPDSDLVDGSVIPKFVRNFQIESSGQNSYDNNGNLTFYSSGNIHYNLGLYLTKSIPIGDRKWYTFYICDVETGEKDTANDWTFNFYSNGNPLSEYALSTRLAYETLKSNGSNINGVRFKCIVDGEMNWQCLYVKATNNNTDDECLIKIWIMIH